MPQTGGSSSLSWSPATGLGLGPLQLEHSASQTPGTHAKSQFFQRSKSGLWNTAVSLRQPGGLGLLICFASYPDLGGQEMVPLPHRGICLLLQTWLLIAGEEASPQ